MSDIWAGITPELYVQATSHKMRWFIEDETDLPHSRTLDEHEHDKGVVERIMVFVLLRGVEALPFILDAIQVAAGDDEVLRWIGAGDLESLFIHHGGEIIDELEAAARTNRPLRVALSNVWGFGPVEERIERLLAEYGPPSRNPH
jgi:hypothetical protein